MYFKITARPQRLGISIAKETPIMQRARLMEAIAVCQMVLSIATNVMGVLAFAMKQADKVVRIPMSLVIRIILLFNIFYSLQN